MNDFYVDITDNKSESFFQILKKASYIQYKASNIKKFFGL